MSENKKMNEKNIKAVSLSDEELEEISGGSVLGMCVNPTCVLFMARISSPGSGYCIECNKPLL